MAMVKAHEADRALSALPPSMRLVLLYGPDSGLVSERGAMLAARAVPDPSDPFQMIRLDGETVASDPQRLIDEALTIGLFGGQRAIRVSPTTRSLAPAVQPLLNDPPQDAFVVIEAGELTKNHPLRVAVERAKAALAVPCYTDGAANLEQLVESVLRDAGIRSDRGARQAAAARLGADRQVSRRELEKLVTYLGGQRELSTADIDAILGDAGAADTDDINDGLFAGAWRVSRPHSDGC
jgi:DNA polymerase III subunit delta